MGLSFDTGYHIYYTDDFEGMKRPKAEHILISTLVEPSIAQFSDVQY